MGNEKINYMATACSSPRVCRPCQRPRLTRQRSSAHMRQKRARAHFRAAVHVAMYCSRVHRLMVVEKVATLQAEKPALSRQRSSAHMRQRRVRARFRAAVHAAMYRSRVQRRMVMEKVATLEAEKPALSASEAVKLVAVEAKKVDQLHVAEKSLRSTQSPWQPSESVSPLAPSALEVGKTASVTYKASAMAVVGSSPDDRPARSDCLVDLIECVIGQKGVGWHQLTMEDVKQAYPQALQGLTDDAKVARRTGTMNPSAVSTPGQQRARHLRNLQVHRVHALEAQIRRLQAQVKRELAQTEFC